MRNRITFVSLYLLVVSNVNSNLLAAEDVLGRELINIHIVGNKRTHDNVIERELLLVIGKKVTAGDIKESQLRLNNLRIFSSVEFLFAPYNNSNLVSLTVKLKERWTTIPIVKYGNGGGSEFFTIGAYDINMFGRNWELGAQYENLNGNDSGVTWFRNPRAFGQRVLVGYDLWSVIRNRDIYDNNANVVSTYTMDKKKLHIIIKKELHWWLEIGTGLDYVTVDLNDSQLSDQQIQTNLDSMFSYSSNSRQLYIDFDLRLGRLNFDGFLVNGSQYNINYKVSNQSLASTQSSNRFVFEYKNFSTVNRDHTFGMGLSVGHTNSTLLQDQFYIGGLSDVRGYKDGEFFGPNYWKLNVEYRFPSFETNRILMQQVFFVDTGNVDDSLTQLLDSNKQVFSSIGTGVRFISPDIYRLNIRVDIAKTFGRRNDMDISIGLQQFF